MTEVEHARSELRRSIQLRREKCSAIASSRKRKLRELFAVATHPNELPNYDLIDPDVHPTHPAEVRFLDDLDILNGRFLDESNLPARQVPRYSPQKSSHASPGPSIDRSSVAIAKKIQADGVQTSTAAQTSHPPRIDTATVSGGGATKSNGTDRDVASSPASTVADTRRNDGPNLLESSSGKDGGLEPQLHDGKSGSITVDERTGAFASHSGPSGRAVNFVEPDNSQAGPRLGSSHAQGGSSRQAAGGMAAAPVSGAMDLDEAPGDMMERTGPVVMGSPQPDSSKLPDLLSSPGSTAQTATTPAAHDVSTDTSPDGEGPQFPDEDDDLVESTKKFTGIHGERNTEGISKQGADSAALQAANAQLLKEAEDAHVSADANVTNHPATQAPLSSNSQAMHAHPTGGNISTPQPSTSLSNQNMEQRHHSQHTEDTVRHVQNPDKQIRAPIPPPEKAQAVPGNPSEPVASTSARRVMTDAPSSAQQKSMPEIRAALPLPTANVSESPACQQRDGHVALSRSRRKSLAEKRHNVAPIVVFGKTPTTPEKTPEENAVANNRIPSDDYFTPLFVDGFTRQSKWMKSIDSLVTQAHKTLSTPDTAIALQDNQACKVLRRVYHLQQSDKWSLRQPKRASEPTRQPSHWDTLLQEMKWMRTDFREERKWKRAAARNLAEDCAEWVAASAEERKALQVNAIIPPKVDRSSSSTGAFQEAEVESLSTPMPDLVASGDAHSPMEIDEEPQEWNVETVAPSQIFAMQDDELVFPLQRSAASDKLLDHLPIYGTPLKVPNKSDWIQPEWDPDTSWRRPALPLSKYVEGKMVLTTKTAPKKRSRYDYETEEEGEDDRVVFSQNAISSAKLPPENTSVALFNPEMKAIRDRLHAGHQFRPPTEFNMPLQSFYESRPASQWTWAEDDDLKGLVREYSYNWSLISNIIQSRSLFISGPERRTPWECFERWVALEGLPNDMAKTQYFQTYQRRMDAAQRVIQQHNQTVQQQVGPNGAVAPQRRRPTTTMRVDKRRNQKHLALIDGMRKLAKKREAVVAKQHQAAAMQAMRKSNENPQQKFPNKTPTEYSRLKSERDSQAAKNMLQQQQMRNAAMAARPQPQQVPNMGAAGAAQMAHARSAANPNAARMGGLQIPGQPQPRVQMQAPQNPAAALAAMQAQAAAQAGGLVAPMPMNGMPQAQGLQQAQMAAGHRMQMSTPQPDINLVLQAKQIRDQQRALLQQHQQHNQQAPQGQQQAQGAQSQQNLPNGSASQQRSPDMRNMNGINGINQHNYLANAQAAMGGSFNSPNGNGMATSPGAAGLSMPSPMAAGSPRGHGLPPQQQTHSRIPPQIMLQLTELQNNFRTKYPTAPPDQIHALAMSHLKQEMERRTAAQNAMSAAAGAAAAANSPQLQAQALTANGMPSATSPHQYAHLLRAQQQQQAALQHQQLQAQQQQQQQQQQQHQRQPSSGAASVNGR